MCINIWLVSLNTLLNLAMIIQGNVQKITKVVKSFLSCRTPDSFSLRSIHHNPKEVTIKVPWGHISGL